MDNNKLISSYIIHTKDYRNNSLLLYLFTKEYGFITATAKGIKNSKKDNKRGLLQPFVLLLISLYGRGELKSVNNIELSRQVFYYNINQLSVGFYINELLYYLCYKDPHNDYSNLFEKYNNLLISLNKNIDSHSLEILIREFELDLLDIIGYGLQYNNIKPDLFYSYCFDDGFYLSSSKNNNSVETNNKLILKGESILKIKNRIWDTKDVKLSAKKLLRSILKYHIGDKEFNSRQLLIQCEKE